MSFALARRPKAWLYAWISKTFMAGCSNYNSLSVRKGSRSKRQARERFAAHDIPHARGEVFINPLAAMRFAREHGFPLCVKPNVGGFSRGSHFPIESMGELRRAAFMVKAWWPTSIVEQYLEGANYRVLATADEIVSVIRRYPPFVDGDGSRTVAQLIDAENATRETMGLYPTMHPIGKEQRNVDHLAEHGLTLDSVPEPGRRVTLFHRVALAPGGIVETIDRVAIPDVNRELFLRVVRAFDANLFGIDVIFERGIEIPYTEQRCIFLEVNSRPYTRMHAFPRRGEADDLEAFHARMDALDIPDRDVF